MTADITLRGPGDVLAVLPYQLGYHPRSCVVAVSLRGRTVGMVARTDLPPDEHVDEAVGSLVGRLQRDGATSVILIGYEDAADASLPVLLALVDRLEAKGVEVVDVVIVRDGRRWSPVCSESCCPPGGVALPDPADVPAVAEFVARGRSPLPSRDAVERLVAADPGLTRDVADAVAARSRMPRRRRRAAVAWRLVLGHAGDPGSGRLLAGAGSGRGDGASGAGGSERSTSSGLSRAPGVVGSPWAPRVVADAVTGLADIAWRDGLVAWLAPGVLPMSEVDRDVLALLHGTLPTWGGMGGRDRVRTSGVGDERVPGDLERDERVSGGPARDEGVPGELARDERVHGERTVLLQRLLTLCRAVPDECPGPAAAVCTVVAHLAWVEGDGAIARAAVDRALRLAPDYRLALLLVRLVDAGVRLPRRDRGEGEKEALGRTG